MNLELLASIESLLVVVLVWRARKRIGTALERGAALTFCVGFLALRLEQYRVSMGGSSDAQDSWLAMTQAFVSTALLVAVALVCRGGVVQKQRRPDFRAQRAKEEARSSVYASWLETNRAKLVHLKNTEAQ